MGVDLVNRRGDGWKEELLRGGGKGTQEGKKMMNQDCLCLYQEKEQKIVFLVLLSPVLCGLLFPGFRTQASMIRG